MAPAQGSRCSRQTGSDKPGVGSTRHRRRRSQHQNSRVLAHTLILQYRRTADSIPRWERSAMARSIRREAGSDRCRSRRTVSDIQPHKTHRRFHKIPSQSNTTQHRRLYRSGIHTDHSRRRWEQSRTAARKGPEADRCRNRQIASDTRSHKRHYRCRRTPDQNSTSRPHKRCPLTIHMYRRRRRSLPSPRARHKDHERDILCNPQTGSGKRCHRKRRRYHRIQRQNNRARPHIPHPTLHRMVQVVGRSGRFATGADMIAPMRVEMRGEKRPKGVTCQTNGSSMQESRATLTERPQR